MGASIRWEFKSATTDAAYITGGFTATYAPQCSPYTIGCSNYYNISDVNVSISDYLTAGPKTFNRAYQWLLNPELEWVEFFTVELSGAAPPYQVHDTYYLIARFEPALNIFNAGGTYGNEADVAEAFMHWRTCYPVNYG